LLQQWAKGGSLATAAQEALLLSGIPEGLQILIDEWALADFKSLPEVELLSAVDISGAMGAYAISTGKIYLNETWVDNASKEDVFAVLTEELGHHLDGLFNTVDTPGDEGQLFAALLTSNVDVSDNKKEAVQAEADHGIAILFGSEVAVEQSKASYTVDTSLVNLKIISGKTGGVASGLASFYSNDEEIILVVGNKYDYSTPSWITSNYILTKSLKSGLENIFDYINPSSKLYTTLANPTIANGNKLIFRGISFSAATFKQTLSFNQIEFNELRPGSQKVIASYEYEDFADSDIHSFFGNKLGDQIVRKNNQLISFGPHSWSSNIPSYENLISVAAGQANDGSAIIVSATGLRKFPVSGEGYQVDGKTVITKINADGTTAWNNEFDFATLGEDYFVANIDDLTHDFLLAGSLQDNLGIGSLISFTAEGTQKWRLDLHNLPHSRITSASIDSSGNIFIAGTWQFDWTWNRYNNMANGIPPSAADVGTNLAFYGLVSKEGTLEWTNTYGDNTGSIFGCEILSAKSGNIILTGTSTSKQIFGITPNVGSSSNGYPYMYGYIAEISVPQSQVRITLTPSAASISEGAVFTSTVAATNLTTGTTLYYALSGTGITTADFSAGALIGEGVTDATGKFSFSHTLANDLTTEGAETLSIKLYSDVARTLQVGSTATVSIVESSTTPVPTYTLTPSAATINEGAVLTNTVNTTNVASGTKFYYALSGTGITTADFSAGALAEEGSTDAAGKFTFTHTLANDLTTEGAESLEINLYSDSARTLQVGSTATVSVADTSINPFNLDIDGDGKVTALGDGLMVIRKLFGAAFAGDVLTNKAISPTATRTTSEIHRFIESGISTGMLDVDKDGKTTALGDGLMVIRHLFGAAFAGAALTNKAISPDSPYFGTPANFAAVAANIDSMRPV